MSYYVFSGTTGTGMAITDDKSGSKLPPPKIGNWVFQREIRINSTDGRRIGASSAEIVEAVKRDGYLLWPIKPTENEDD
jgi:hypothetical protein